MFMKKSMLVTGATAGTGYAIASRFAREGYSVFITSRNGENAAKAAKKLTIEYGIKAIGYELSPGNETHVIEIFDDIRRMGYLIDTVVLNAANFGFNMDPFTV